MSATTDLVGLALKNGPTPNGFFFTYPIDDGKQAVFAGISVEYLRSCESTTYVEYKHNHKLDQLRSKVTVKLGLSSDEQYTGYY